MRTIGILLAVITAALGTAFSQEELQPLPIPLTNNAVTSVKVEGQTLVYSFMGLASTKNWDAVKNTAYALNLRFGKWTPIRSIQGPGRIGAVAVSVKEEVFVIGGYVPDKTGIQAIVSDVSVYEPIGLRWYRGPDLPIAVRDAIGGEYHDRYAYVVGGFSSQGPTNAVQLYDTETKQWSQATPYPGSPSFGAAGAVVGDTIIYIDGAKASGTKTPPWVASDECWMGKIDRKDPKKIDWSKLPAHPGSARYRIAAGASDKDAKVYFAGGSAEIFDYNGIAVDGKPAEPSPVVFDYNVKRGAWEIIMDNAPNPSMDHRGLAVTSDELIVVGGMGKDQKVQARVQSLPKEK